MGIYACGGYGSRCPEEGCHGNEAMGIYACGGYGSRCPEKAVMGMMPWGYMQEEVRKEEGRRWDFHLKSNNPSLRGGEKTEQIKCSPDLSKFSVDLAQNPLNPRTNGWEPNRKLCTTKSDRLGDKTGFHFFWLPPSKR